MEYERYKDGSPTSELVEFAELARKITSVQQKNRGRRGAIDRAFHAKALLGVENAQLVVRDDLPPELEQGCFRSGAVLSVTLRFSNGTGVPQHDTVDDLRGVALRIALDEGRVHDLLLTNFEVSPAANARQFVEMAVALAGRSSPASRLFGLVTRLPFTVGPRATIRIVTNLRRSARATDSLAAETYWSRGAILWGEAGPIRYRLSPVGPLPVSGTSGADRLRLDIAERLLAGAVMFDLNVQRFVSEEQTPVEDTSRTWPTPWVCVGRLIVPGQDLDTPQARLVERRVDRLAFNPWNTTSEFRPLGNLNRARRAAYEASSAQRLGQRFVTERPVREGVVGAAASGVFGVVNRFVVWHRLPKYLALLNLSVLRQRLRRSNLIHTEPRPDRVQVRTPDPSIPEGASVHRTQDGSYNDLAAPRVGAVGARFGRNMPLEANPSDEPDPIRVANELLARERFVPAPSLNVLAAAWLQFQVHDWVDHPRFPVDERSVRLPVTDGRAWRNTTTGGVESEMRFAENLGDWNTASHWWDGSEIYGTDPDLARSLREHGGAGARLQLAEGHLPTDRNGRPRAGFTDGWWLGLSTLHTLFAREHNAVCDALHAEYPNLTAEQTYQTARLIVSALIAKIHTVEWTLAALATETLDAAMNINWRGAPNDLFTRLGLRLLDSHAMHPLAGSLPDDSGVPFALTEEFVTVYRMHPLIPDDYAFVDHSDGKVRAEVGFADIQGDRTERFLQSIGLTDALYSLGIANPGAVTLHNFPRALREFVRGEEIIDLAVADIVRTRRRAVPRYNDFRVGLNMKRIRRFEDLTAEPGTLARLRDLYSSVDEIDTVIGLLAENPPAGFAFGDTAFRVFLLMASRRLQSDRFLTVDYRPGVYTPLGMDWIDRGTMAGVLLRHCPELAGTVGPGKAAFAPWR